MRTKSIFIQVVLMLIMSVALLAQESGDGNAANNPLGIPQAAQNNTVLSGGQTTSADVPHGPKELLQDYEAGMAAITQRFTATLVDITQAVHRGELTSEQGQVASGEQFQLAQMQFELLAAWHTMLQQDLARVPVPAPEAAPTRAEDNEIVTVTLPFSSFQFDSSLAEHLSLSKSQSEAIQQVMTRERSNHQALLAQLRTTREKLRSADPQHTSNKEIKALAARQAGLLAKLIVANARMKSNIYKLLTPEQQQKLGDFARSRELITSK